MIRRTAVLLALGILAGCEIDDSMPSRPRTGSILTPDQKAQENAEQRSLERPQCQLPTGGSEFPGQSMAPSTLQAPADLGVVTLDVTEQPAVDPYSTNPFPKLPITGFRGPSGKKAIGRTVGPVTVYNRDSYTGIVTHLPANPGVTPIEGAAVIPGGEWAVDYSWGQGLVLAQSAHRNWPVTSAAYKTADIRHNPTYYFNLQEHLLVKGTPVPQSDGTYKGDVISSLYEIPWFGLNTVALPALMILEKPFAQRVTRLPEGDPTYTGHVPEGPLVPTPQPGQLKWDYPFLNPDGTVKPTEGSGASSPR